MTQAERNQQNAGRGLTRIQIAQKAVDRLKEKLEAAEARLEAAKKAGAEPRKARTGSPDGKRAMAARSLIGLGVAEADIVRILKKGVATQEEAERAIADAKAAIERDRENLKKAAEAKAKKADSVDSAE